MFFSTLSRFHLIRISRKSSVFALVSLVVRLYFVLKVLFCNSGTDFCRGQFGSFGHIGYVRAAN
jgi:hypothetical protein